jgi:hypothetical protein
MQLLVFDFKRKQVSVAGDAKAAKALADFMAAQRNVVKVGSTAQVVSPVPQK